LITAAVRFARSYLLEIQYARLGQVACDYIAKAEPPIHKRTGDAALVGYQDVSGVALNIAVEYVSSRREATAGSA